MKLNLFETLAVNNPARELMLVDTVRWLQRAGGHPTLRRVLEIGCGQGDGVRHIARRFRPETIDAFDLDEAQVARARRRLDPARLDARLRLFVGDGEHIDAPDGAYDGVFEFTIFHHIPDWRAAQREVFRVLRPGGLFLFEELSLEFFTRIPVLSPLLHRFTVHPWDTMFDFPQFEQGLREAGFTPVRLWSNMVPGAHRGVMRKPADA